MRNNSFKHIYEVHIISLDWIKKLIWLDDIPVKNRNYIIYDDIIRGIKRLISEVK